MFFHVKELQYQAMPERPDPIYAKKLQEILGGQFGEMTVMMAYLFQGWNCRGPEKYRDMLLDIGTDGDRPRRDALGDDLPSARRRAPQHAGAGGC